jgi:hypothetical protein
VHRHGAVAAVVGACAIAVLGGLELGCLRCCVEDLCEGGPPNPDLLVLVGAQYDQVEITTSGACTAVTHTETSEDGTRLWRGELTRIAETCTVSAVLDGVASQETFTIGESCGGPQPKYIYFGVFY